MMNRTTMMNQYTNPNQDNPDMDDDPDDDEKPKLGSRKTGKGKTDDDNRCPYGHRFGIDCETKDDCDQCDEWDECIEYKEKGVDPPF